MSARQKLQRLLADPAGVARRTLRRLASPGRGYVPAEYWAERHAELAFDTRGVGRIDGSREENDRMIAAGNATMRELWRREGIVAANVSLLDVGCGQGHHAGNFAAEGGRRYTGVDITDVLFPELRRRYPDFQFLKADASREPLPGSHDVVVMVNVAEHIVTQELFGYAMENVRSRLRPGGAFVVTVPSGEAPATPAAHWAHWPLEAVLARFPGFEATVPVPFWDKSLVVLRPAR